jgi:hypothetical protein
MMISLARAQADEAGRGGDAERHAEVNLGNPELRFGGGPPEVAGERQTPAAADRVAVDHRDRRLLQVLEQRGDALEEAPELVRRRTEHVTALLGGHPAAGGEVRAGREDGRRAGDDHHSRAGVVAQLHERRGGSVSIGSLSELRRSRTVQGDGRDRAFTNQGDVRPCARTVS